MPPAPELRYHILTFAPGERFRYTPDGPAYTLAKDARGRYKARREGRPDALVDLQSYVIAVDPPSGADSGLFDGLGLSGFDPASAEEGGGA